MYFENKKTMKEVVNSISNKKLRFRTFFDRQHTEVSQRMLKSRPQTYDHISL